MAASSSSTTNETSCHAEKCKNGSQDAATDPVPIASGHSPAQQSQANNLGFRYIWPVKIQLRQLGANGENTILHISPKFGTVHEHVSFLWTLKMHGTPWTTDADDEEETPAKKLEQSSGKEDDEEEGSPSSADKGYVAISLYYLDGPVSNVRLRAQVRIVGEKGAKRRDSEEVQAFLEERNTVTVCRGHECELAFKDRAHLSNYIRQNIGHVIRLSLLLEMDAALFRADTYLNAVSPTPIHSFLTANYRARASSKIWKKRSNRRPRSASDGHHCHLTGNKKLDLERTFNRVMERERERRELSKSSRRSSQRQSLNKNAEEAGDGKNEKEGQQQHGPNGFLLASSTVPTILQPAEQHLFKKLLVACCESCERRASLIPMSMGTAEEEAVRKEKPTVDDEEDNAAETEPDDDEAEAEVDEETPFECDEENKTEVHDALANMYFNKVVLPDLEYVEDFVDFLIDAELNDLPVLKRACERYLCGELNTKKELMTSLILDLFFIAMVFQLPVMKSMTLTELCERYSELEDVEKLLEQDEYKNLDKRIRQLCGDRNLYDLVDECKRFREQCLRVQCVDLSQVIEKEKESKEMETLQTDKKQSDKKQYQMKLNNPT